MIPEPALILVFILLIVGYRRGITSAYLLFCPLCLLGSAAAFSFPALGGITIGPGVVGVLAMVLIVLFDQATTRKLFHAFYFPNPGFWLLIIVVFSAIGSFFLPRLFAGMTYVNAIGSTSYGPSSEPVPLGPSSGNITQTIYFIVDMLCFCLTYAIASSYHGQLMVAKSVLIYAMFNCIFGILDVVTFYTNTSFIFAPIRNAAYALHEDTVVNGFKRINGSFNEASSFASTTLGVVGFTIQLWLAGKGNIWLALLIFLSLVLLLLSTSSTAYAGLAVLLSLLYFETVAKFIFRTTDFRSMTFILISVLLCTVCLIVILLNDNYYRSASEFLNAFLFEKSSTQSGIERGKWNEYSIANFFDTYYAGVGLGSARSSSFVLAVISNLGLFGAIAYFTFMFRYVVVPNFGNDYSVSKAITSASRMACLSLLIASSISGTLVDLGIVFFIHAALAVSKPANRPR
ncbi:hypothetical protein [Methylobacterium mesophilicum]